MHAQSRVFQTELDPDNGVDEWDARIKLAHLTLCKSLYAFQYSV